MIEEVVRSGGVCERDQVMNLYQTNPDLERYSDWSASWKTRRFKDIAAGMGYQVNPGRTGNRWQQKVNGEMKDFYELVRPLQPEAPKDQNGSPAIQTNAEKAAADLLDNYQVLDIIVLIYSKFIPFSCKIFRAGSRSFL